MLFTWKDIFLNSEIKCNGKIYDGISNIKFNHMKLDNSEIYIFFDDGNVLNDNQIRRKQWQKLVGEYLAPRFGGEPK